MKIQTFQKLSQKFFQAIMLPVSFITVTWMYFSEQKWNNYWILTSIGFIFSLIIFLYYLMANIAYGPLKYLINVYKDNKRFKKIRKLEIPSSETVEDSLKIEEKQVKRNTPEPIMSGLPFQRYKSNQSTKAKKSKPITFTQQEQNTEINQLPFSFLNKSNRSKEGNRAMMQKYQNPTSLDIKNLFNNGSTKNDKKNLNNRNKPRLEQLSPKTLFNLKRQEDEQMSDISLEQYQPKFQEITSQQQMKKNYQLSYLLYKQTLKNFSFDKQIIEKMLMQTRYTVRQKIEQNLQLQLQNLDRIQSLIRKNYAVNFRSYKQKTPHFKNQNLYGLNTSNSFHLLNQKVPLNYGATLRNSVNTVKEKTFKDVLQEIKKLFYTNYIDFQYIGDIEKQKEMKKQIRFLLKQRIQLDKYLSLKEPLKFSQEMENISRSITKSPKQLTQYEEERYFHILKLQSLVFILSQRDIAQNNLLKEFFSKPHTLLNEVDEKIQKINDQHNIQLLLNFMVKIFNKKIQQANSSDLIKIELSHPNFKDKNTNYIWIRKINSFISHYNITYSLRKDKNISERLSEKSPRKEESKDSPQYEKVYCIPGQNNIWMCILFVRILISKIGLRKQQYPLIKDKELKKDVQRLIELLK